MVTQDTDFDLIKILLHDRFKCAKISLSSRSYCFGEIEKKYRKYWKGVKDAHYEYKTLKIKFVMPPSDGMHFNELQDTMNNIERLTGWVHEYFTMKEKHLELNFSQLYNGKRPEE